MRGQRGNLDVRFWNKIEKTPTCWIWKGNCYENGYGRIMYNQKRWVASRLSWYLHNGSLDENILVLHKCDNPICVNPDHLFLGTKSDNVIDMVNKGRHHSQKKTHCKNGHELSGDNLKISKSDHRYCKHCHVESMKIAGLRRQLVRDTILIEPPWKQYE